MKKIIFFATVISFIFGSCGATSTESEAPSVDSDKTDFIAVYDFHTDHRCETCLAIEAATKETLNKNFKNQLEDETITFTLINADAEENQAIAEEYGAFGTTLAITLFKGEKKEIIDITNWAFDAVHGDNFESELTHKLKDVLAKL